MSLVRNLTRRARGQTRGEEAATLPRSCTVRLAPGTINRAKISLPTALLSTTNVDAMNAPDIRKGAAVSSTASSSSDSVHSDSDFASIDKGFLSADNSSSSELSPLTPLTPIDFDNKDFFSSKSTTGPSLSAEPTPAIPQRAPSHSKKAHVELSKQMSIKRSMSPPPATIPESSTSRDTLAMFSTPSQESSAAPVPSSHPFSKELAKVDELAEGFGSGLVILDEEEQEMMEKGLQKFSVDDYVAELAGLHGGVFEDKISLNPWM